MPIDPVVNKMYAFNLPSPYQAEMAKIADQRRMAEMLQAQSQAPTERFSYKGIEARTPFTAGLAKALQGLSGAYFQKQAREEEKALGERYRGEQMGDMSELISGLNAPAVAGSAAIPEQLAGRPFISADEEGNQMPDVSAAPAIPAVVARAAGQIDPSMMGRMKTPEGANQVLALVMAQRQAQIDAERRANEPYTLAEGAGRYQPMPGGQPAQLIAGGMPKTPFAPIDVSKFTPESVQAAMRQDGSVDRTALRAIPERATGDIAVYNEYVRQTMAAGKVPKSIDQFITDQKIAGRTPAAITYGSPVAATDAAGNSVFLQPGKTGGPPSVISGFTPPSPAVAKELINIQQSRSTIQGAINAVQAAPTAFSFKRGTATAGGPVTESIAGRFDTPQETEARAYVYNNVSSVIKERAGTAQSAQELTRINSFLPGDRDNAEQIINKLNGFLKYLNDFEAGTVGKPTKATVPTAQAPIYANAPGKPRMMSTDGGKTWTETK